MVKEAEEAEEAGERAEPGEAPASAEDRASRVLRTFAEEPTLWPVAVVVFLSAISFGSLILVMAIRARSLVAGLALLMLIFLTVYRLDPDIRAKRLRPMSVALVAFWIGSASVGALLAWLGAF
jgi:hypothetical protein